MLVSICVYNYFIYENYINIFLRSLFKISNKAFHCSCCWALTDPSFICDLRVGRCSFLSPRSLRYAHHPERLRPPKAGPAPTYKWACLRDLGDRKKRHPTLRSQMNELELHIGARCSGPPWGFECWRMAISCTVLKLVVAAAAHSGKRLFFQKMVSYGAAEAEFKVLRTRSHHQFGLRKPTTFGVETFSPGLRIRETILTSDRAN